MLVGYLRDRTGTYSIGFVVLVAMGLVGAIAVALLKQGAVTAEAEAGRTQPV